MSHNFCHLWARTDPLQVHLQVPLLGTRHLPVQVTPGPQSPIHLNGTEEISEGLQRATDYPQGGHGRGKEAGGTHLAGTSAGWKLHHPSFPPVFTLSQFSSLIHTKEVPITFPRRSTCQVHGSVSGSNAMEIAVLFLFAEATYQTSLQRDLVW